MSIGKVEQLRVSFEEELDFLDEHEQIILAVMLRKIKKHGEIKLKNKDSFFAPNLIVDLLFSSNRAELMFTTEHMVNVLSSELFKGDMDVVKDTLENVLKGVYLVNKKDSDNE